ncbi:MAG: hypothetical protein SGI92_01575 [Bryobacteraceae bacterium]|nr:hypothetical protein [Bryobacteraceae bacterium]
MAKKKPKRVTRHTITSQSECERCSKSDSAQPEKGEALGPARDTKPSDNTSALQHLYWYLKCMAAIAAAVQAILEACHAFGVHPGEIISILLPLL